MIGEYSPIIIPLEVATNEPGKDLTVVSDIEEISLDMGASVNVEIISGEKYEGETTITPKAYSETILATKNKVVRDNIHVLQVPYYEVSNVTGGLTVYIAEGVNE